MIKLTDMFQTSEVDEIQGPMEEETQEEGTSNNVYFCFSSLKK